MHECYRDVMQMTLRVDEALAGRLKHAAAARGQSVNAFAGAVLGAAVDPDLAGAEIDRLRERLDQAGLLALAAHTMRGDAPSEDALKAARRRAGEGRSLADLVLEERG